MSQQTQRKNTLGTYRRLAPLIPKGSLVLDYGAGYCLGAHLLGADSFEPNPREGVRPTFEYHWQMFTGVYDVVVCNCVLNVIDNRVDQYRVVQDIERVLKPGGVAYIMVRSWPDVEKAKYRTWEGDGWRMATGSFQRGYSYEELDTFVRNFGATERIREVSNIGVRLTIP